MAGNREGGVPAEILAGLLIPQLVFLSPGDVGELKSRSFKCSCLCLF